VSRNIGFTKKEAEELAKKLDGFCVCDVVGSPEQPEVEAYAQKEEHFKSMMGNGDAHTHQWIVVLQKRKPK